MLKDSDSGALGEETRRLLEAELAKAEAQGLPDRPLDGSGVTGRQLRDEASKGVLGPAGRAYLDHAASEGPLDLPIPASPGMTFRGALEKARELSAKAEDRAAELASGPGEGAGDGEDPAKIVPLAIEHLNSDERERRVYGAQLLCDIRVAGHPLAQAARAELLRAKDSKDADLSGFATMALRRLDHFSARREAGSAR